MISVSCLHSILKFSQTSVVWKVFSGNTIQKLKLCFLTLINVNYIRNLWTTPGIVNTQYTDTLNGDNYQNKILI